MGKESAPLIVNVWVLLQPSGDSRDKTHDTADIRIHHFDDHPVGSRRDESEK